MFPSPIGVIFSLIKIKFNSMNILRYLILFPSPIGVIFSLIICIPHTAKKSISFRLLSELYSLLYTLQRSRLIIEWVSVSYRSYILSYDAQALSFIVIEYHQCFRLLSELYSLLFLLICSLVRAIIEVSVSYRSYILSYIEFVLCLGCYPDKFPSPIGVIFSLINNFFTCATFKYSKFPSPIGVIFSLIQKVRIWIDNAKIFRFPSPIGVIFSLIKRAFWRAVTSIFGFPSPIGVIFSLISNFFRFSYNKFYFSFRLLSELYSLLFERGWLLYEVIWLF